MYLCFEKLIINQSKLHALSPSWHQTLQSSAALPLLKRAVPKACWSDKSPTFVTRKQVQQLKKRNSYLFLHKRVNIPLIMHVLQVSGMKQQLSKLSINRKVSKKSASRATFFFVFTLDLLRNVNFHILSVYLKLFWLLSVNRKGSKILLPVEFNISIIILAHTYWHCLCSHISLFSLPQKTRMRMCKNKPSPGYTYCLCISISF